MPTFFEFGIPLEFIKSTSHTDSNFYVILEILGAQKEPDFLAQVSI